MTDERLAMTDERLIVDGMSWLRDSEIVPPDARPGRASSAYERLVSMGWMNATRLGSDLLVRRGRWMGLAIASVTWIGPARTEPVASCSSAGWIRLGGWWVHRRVGKLEGTR